VGSRINLHHTVDVWKSVGVDAAVIKRILGSIALTFVALTPLAAASPDEQRGKTFAINNCARCHAIDRVGRRLCREQLGITITLLKPLLEHLVK